jgi:phosphoglycerate kinase
VIAPDFLLCSLFLKSAMKSISSLSLAGKKVLLRVDFNVPLNASFEVTDDTRLRATIPTIRHLTEEGASVILMSHLGRPKDGPADKYSLRHVIPALEKLLEKPVQFASDCIGAEATEKAGALKPGEILLLENLRFYKEEEKGDTDFARKLAGLGNVYVNDAFGTAHRAHASTAVMVTAPVPLAVTVAEPAVVAPKSSVATVTAAVLLRVRTTSSVASISV